MTLYSITLIEYIISTLIILPWAYLVLFKIEYVYDKLIKINDRQGKINRVLKLNRLYLVLSILAISSLILTPYLSHNEVLLNVNSVVSFVLEFPIFVISCITFFPVFAYEVLDPKTKTPTRRKSSNK